MSDVIVLNPKMSEKAYNMSQDSGVYVFNVPMSANKNTIAKAVKQQFEVEVKSVNIAVIKGKPKKSYRKRMRPLKSSRTNSKQAYVKLAEGQTIKVYPEPEKEDKKADKKPKKEKV